MRLLLAPLCLASSLALSGCAFDQTLGGPDAAIVEPASATVTDGYPIPQAAPKIRAEVRESWGEPQVVPAGLKGPHAVADTDGPYLLDSGDKLRIFVYGQPNLSRVYTVDHGGMITVPLIGAVKARGLTTFDLEGTIRGRLGAKYVRDPQVTVDMQQNRPFFILGEVKQAGQYPYVSGMTIETAVAIAGGYSERASTRSFRLTRRINGMVEQLEVPSDYIVQAGDTVYVFERLF